MTDAPATPQSLLERMRHLYEAESPRAVRFRYALLTFDLATVAFLVGSSFVPHGPVIESLDAIVGLFILADFIARMAISRARLRELAHPATWADLVAIGSFLAPIVGEAGGFLRVLRTVRLLHTYQLLHRLRRDSGWFLRNEEIVLATVHLGVFIFIMTALVYETQHLINPQITNYADALYFTVTALTTTGFGDITLQGTVGRLTAVLIMILGVTLFFNLATAVLRPKKVRFQCPTCGLRRHEPDAVHCKACGTLLNIPNDNYL